MRRLALVLLLALPISAMATPDPAPAPAAPAAPSEREVALMELTGGSFASGSFGAIQAVGAFADALADTDRTDPALAVKLRGLEGGLSGMVDLIDTSLKKGGFATAEVNALQAFRTIFTDLAAASAALASWNDARTPANAKAFRDARERAWAGIADALGFDEGVRAMLAPGGATLGQ